MEKSNAIIMLSPPRSFSSVVCGMLGRHPQLYGLPEVNLFVSDTIEGWYIFHTQHKKRIQSTYGLLRVIAQLHEEQQTEESIDRAWDWLAKRGRWSTHRLWEYLSTLVYPKILIDKSPLTSMRIAYMKRALRMVPNASFIHLTRHPVPATKSIAELREKKKKQGAESNNTVLSNETSLQFWYRTHHNIMQFISSLAEGQSLRLQGERILEENDKYLIQVAEWLGLRSDLEAIEAMKHPEYSPYACVGPLNARYGNDLKFLMDPELRPAKFKLPQLNSHPFYDEVPVEHQPDILNLTHQLGYR